MKSALVIAAIGEAATGLGLLVLPSLVGQLLLGVELTGISISLARVAGIALYLAYLGLAGGMGGVLLWPAVALHVILTALLLFGSSTEGTRAKT